MSSEGSDFTLGISVTTESDGNKRLTSSPGTDDTTNSKVPACPVVVHQSATQDTSSSSTSSRSSTPRSGRSGSRKRAVSQSRSRQTQRSGSRRRVDTPTGTTKTPKGPMLADLTEGGGPKTKRVPAGGLGRVPDPVACQGLPLSLSLVKGQSRGTPRRSGQETPEGGAPSVSKVPKFPIDTNERRSRSNSYGPSPEAPT